jgi:transposase
MKKPVLVGIDVSASSFAVAEEVPGCPVREAEYPNTEAGHGKLCRRLEKIGRPVQACLEASGVYHLDLALALHRTRSVTVMVANPRATRAFAHAQMQRSKTDATDARSLLEFSRRMPFSSWAPPSPEILALRAIARRIAALTVTITQERNRRHATNHCREYPPVLGDEIDAHLEFLTASIDRLATEARRLIDDDAWLSKAFTHMVSVRGIAQASAVAILGELAALPRDMSARQWVAHAGIDPRHHQSGISVHKPSRISRTGNRRLRAALYMPALVAIRYEPNVKAFYEKLIQAGKKPKQAITAVMRKLLHAIWGMLHHDCDFQGDKFYKVSP